MPWTDRHGMYSGKTLVSRADLILLLDELGEEGLSQACAAACYQRVEKESDKPPQRIGSKQPPEPTGPTSKPKIVKEEPLTFWYPQAVKSVKKAADSRPDWFQKAIPHTKSDFYPDDRHKPPPHQDLCHWRRLWPFLQYGLGEMQSGGDIDLLRTVKLIAEVKTIRRLPMQTHGSGGRDAAY